MALVFRCDGCERLEGHDPRNKWQSEKAGTINLTKTPDKFSSSEEHSAYMLKDLCKECLGKVEEFIKKLAVKQD